MACSEGDKLKNEVLSRVEEYLDAEQALNMSSSFDEEFSRVRTERAHALVFEARQRYFRHLETHRCEAAETPSRLNAIAV